MPPHLIDRKKEIPGLHNTTQSKNTETQAHKAHKCEYNILPGETTAEAVYGVYGEGRGAQARVSRSEGGAHGSRAPSHACCRGEAG